MDGTILLFLLQDGITNGAIYALLGIALVLVFAVTRVIFIPQGELVAFGALTYALLEAGKVPGTVWLLAGFGLLAFVFDVVAAARERALARRLAKAVLIDLAIPGALVAATLAVAGRELGSGAHFALTLALITPLGPLLYRVAFQPIAGASILTLMITAVGVHLALVGLGLVFFGAEGLRAPAVSDLMVTIGPMLVTGQSLAVYAVATVAIVALWLFFDRALWGKALRATAVNRLGARLVGIRTGFAGSLAFALAALVAALSGVLIAPMTTIYYDTGFLIGLKGFVAAIIAGLASYPLTALAALGVGIVEALASFFASDMKEIIVFMLIIPVLLWRSLKHTHVEEED
ncbi:branched-chain amino acid ABC transporter permease [Pinisolibacter aquiterrae]|uniref:branched-chain amino acid ABC transporter permease n=1 Tax=Pinisolibacter aquiterrae TaxID=2815579 RepID=UPI001C3E6ECC|nr:branched-chain amino acid ABC transporter permease [Pinisolibacter aquiterrae]MCC8234672.1 branched-chain amino acid ABC transporter permease [Pinisolibacter aquiterrae]